MTRTTHDIRSFFGALPPTKKRCTREQQDVHDSSQLNKLVSATSKVSKVENYKQQYHDEEHDHEKVPSDDTDKEQSEVGQVKRFADLHNRAYLRSIMHQSWFDLLQKHLAHDSFQALTRFLEGEEDHKKTLYPPPADVFAAMRDCAFSDLKVVILGQDPYHGPQQAHGLSFSVRQGIPPPPSLKNIFKEAMTDVGISRPSHGCLSCWSRQGVLLLNTVLTVRRGEPHSHKKRGWEQFTDAVISKVSKDASNVVFLLWGKPAQEKGSLIDSTRHLVVRSSHPSPLGATKTTAPFLGSRCFSRANSYLKKHGKEPIDWSVQ